MTKLDCVLARNVTLMRNVTNARLDTLDTLIVMVVEMDILDFQCVKNVSAAVLELSSIPLVIVPVGNVHVVKAFVDRVVTNVALDITIIQIVHLALVIVMVPLMKSVILKVDAVIAKMESLEKSVNSVLQENMGSLNVKIVLVMLLDD